MLENELIAAARAKLILEEPDFYSDDVFDDSRAFVEGLEDLNGDGSKDVLVFPGMNYAGANSDIVVYLTDSVGCPTVFAGYFSMTDLMIARDGAVHEGVLDLMGVNNSGCESEITRYIFNGVRYEDGETKSEDLCNPCPTEDELIARSRELLLEEEPDFYTPDSFSDENARVEGLEDLNGDGVEDALVFPGKGYAGANVDQLVFLSDADGCTTQHVGSFSESGLSPTEDGAVHEGVRDLLGVNNSGCSSAATTYAFDGQRYVEDDTDYTDLCSH